MCGNNIKCDIQTHCFTSRFFLRHFVKDILWKDMTLILKICVQKHVINVFKKTEYANVTTKSM